MKKFPKVRYPNDSETDGLMNDEVVVTEKFDGANFRFRWDEQGTLHIGTRNVEYHDALNNENLPKAFEHAVEYLDRTIEQEQREAARGTFYGEAMHLHSLDYDDIDWEQPSSGSPHVPPDSDQPNVVVFDWMVSDEWCYWDNVVETAERLGLETVPVLERGDPDDLSFEVPEESWLGGPPEGVVARRVDGQVRAKKVTEDFREKNAVAFESPSKAESDSAEFVAAYVTEPRIEKTAHKLVDEGEYDELKMQMMEDLPREVLRDVMVEEGWNLLTSGGFEGEWDDDFKSEVRSRASKKCARVLKAEVNSF